jgi:hypothetical protein
VNQGLAGEPASAFGLGLLEAPTKKADLLNRCKSLVGITLKDQARCHCETFSEAVYRLVYSHGQFGRPASAPRGTARSAMPTACASADGSAPSAELSAPTPRRWESLCHCRLGCRNGPDHPLLPKSRHPCPFCGQLNSQGDFPWQAKLIKPDSSPHKPRNTPRPPLAA